MHPMNDEDINDEDIKDEHSINNGWLWNKQKFEWLWWQLWGVAKRHKEMFLDGLGRLPHDEAVLKFLEAVANDLPSSSDNKIETLKTLLGESDGWVGRFRSAQGKMYNPGVFRNWLYYGLLDARYECMDTTEYEFKTWGKLHELSQIVLRHGESAYEGNRCTKEHFDKLSAHIIKHGIPELVKTSNKIGEYFHKFCTCCWTVIPTDYLDQPQFAEFLELMDRGLMDGDDEYRSEHNKRRLKKCLIVLDKIEYTVIMHEFEFDGHDNLKKKAFCQDRDMTPVAYTKHVESAVEKLRECFGINLKQEQKS